MHGMSAQGLPKKVHERGQVSQSFLRDGAVESMSRVLGGLNISMCRSPTVNHAKASRPNSSTDTSITVAVHDSSQAFSASDRTACVTGDFNDGRSRLELFVLRGRDRGVEPASSLRRESLLLSRTEGNSSSGTSSTMDGPRALCVRLDRTVDCASGRTSSSSSVIGPSANSLGNVIEDVRFSTTSSVESFIICCRRNFDVGDGDSEREEPVPPQAGGARRIEPVSAGTSPDKDMLGLTGEGEIIWIAGRTILRGVDMVLEHNAVEADNARA